MISCDRDDSNDRRSGIACLVQGVYAMEKDRVNNQQSQSNALAPSWWASFGFDLHRELIDITDSSIFGAIYKHSTPLSGAPKYIIAFRGSAPTIHYWKHIMSCFNQSPHPHHHDIACKALRETLDSASNMSADVWLAGHSLGAAVAISAAKRMVKERGAILETYLFNPPYPSLPFEKIESDTLKRMIRCSMDLATVVLGGVGVASGASEKEFKALSEWVPWVFVNTKDLISMEYKGYFEHRKKMEAMGGAARRIVRVSTRNSFMDLYPRMVRSGLETTHLLPSARLVIATCGEDNMNLHGIRQWWLENLELECKEFSY
ncbi:GDSL esterase/lipase [Acorus calamus]|uniref:GDSL esterase/lipase n=1 Tax=Acorus calamus TaxID=4465 RepID=A0AAV9DNE9_ACOCL|nr:GDSL esterase/lipase [Acorus calamus]